MTRLALSKNGGLARSVTGALFLAQSSIQTKPCACFFKHTYDRKGLSSSLEAMATSNDEQENSIYDEAEERAHKEAEATFGSSYGSWDTDGMSTITCFSFRQINKIRSQENLRIQAITIISYATLRDVDIDSHVLVSFYLIPEQQYASLSAAQLGDPIYTIEHFVSAEPATDKGLLSTFNVQGVKEEQFLAIQVKVMVARSKPSQWGGHLHAYLSRVRIIRIENV